MPPLHAQLIVAVGKENKMFDILRNFALAAYRVFLPMPERKYAEECDTRQPLTDDEFLEKYYSGKDFSADIPIRLRRLLSRVLGAHKVIPSDNVFDIYQDVDFMEIVYEVGEEFDMGISVDEASKCDGTFDSLVRLLVEKIGSLR